jgi:hypothetical protein
MMIMINTMKIHIIEGSRKRPLVKHSALENKDMKNIERIQHAQSNSQLSIN